MPAAENNNPRKRSGTTRDRAELLRAIISATSDPRLQDILRRVDVFEVCRLCTFFCLKLYQYVSRHLEILQQDGEHYVLLSDGRSCCHIKTLCLCYLLQFWGCDLKMPIPPASTNDTYRDELMDASNQLWTVLGYSADRRETLETFVVPVEGGNSLNPDNVMLYFIGGIMERTNLWISSR
jgi:hypothetical protein